MWLRSIATIAFAVLIVGCVATYQVATEADLEMARVSLAPLPDDDVPDSTPQVAAGIDGSVEGYVATALERSPSLRAAFERWRSTVYRIPQARHIPEPTLTYGYYIRSVETRVGPQRHKLSLSFMFPWPTKLTAGADAASIAARATQRRFEAAAHALRHRVARIYWQLWQIDQIRQVQRDQLVVLESLGETTRGRVEVGSANLADLNQVDLTIARLEDVLAGLGEQERSLRASLQAAVGTSLGDAPIEPRRIPDGLLPSEPRQTLLDSAVAHPAVESLSLMSEASGAKIRRARADRAPSFVVGMDWIETGEALDPNAVGSGDDPLLLRIGLTLPLWANTSRAAEQEATAEGEAFRAQSLDSRNLAEAELDQTLAAIRDAARRIDLYRGTLIPQAETTYASVVGAYQTGRSTVASTLLVQRELLELALGLARARAEHAIAWARLEAVVGRTVDARREQ